MLTRKKLQEKRKTLNEVIADIKGPILDGREMVLLGIATSLLDHADEADRVIEQLRNVIEEYKEDLKQQLAIATGGGCCHSVPCRCVATITDLYRKRFVRIDTALAAGQGREKA
jgi:hypothetical protein